MTMTDNATTTATRVFNAPQLHVPLPELFQTVELFAGVSEAQVWVDRFGSEVLKDQALEVVTNLLGANSDERRNRGLLTLERAILAQAAWLQLFELMVPCGRINQLKELTSALRDKDSSSEEHQSARDAALTAFEEFSQRRREADELLAKMVELASEETFVFAARTGSIIGGRGQSMGLYPWQVECLDEVLAGRGYRVAVKTLGLTTDRLTFLSRIHFGEITHGNNEGGKSKGRSAKKAEKAARDRELRASMRGKSGGKPARGKRS